MILVTGGTGTVGKEVVRELAAAGASTRVLVRTPEKAAPLKGLKVDFMIGDLDRPATLGPALKGVEAVFLLTGADPRQAEIQGNMVKAAKAAGVKRIVKLSALGTDDKSPVALSRWHRQTEKEIEASGMAWTFLRPHYFMQNTLGFAPTIKAQGAFYAPLGDAKVAMVDVRDVAAVAAKALFMPGHEGKVYDVTGPEAVSYHDVAAALSEAAGKTVKYVPVGFNDARKAMSGAGMPAWLVDDLIKLNEAFAAGHGAAVSPAAEKVLGRKGTSFRKFAGDYAAAFK
jgi:uncharacterized protein YbjT (DUF2867 family)